MVTNACPVAAPGTAGTGPSVAEVFRRYGPAYLRSRVQSPEQARVLRHILDCRTPALGGRAHWCDHCGASWQKYHSCRDRHCPICQGAQQLAWIEGQLERVLPTHYFHVVFTLPELLRAVALANQRLVYDLLFAAATETLLELARTHWDAVPGITSVLHTWTRQMEYHPHLHCIVTGGGLGLDGDSWVSCPTDFLFHIWVLGELFRGKFLAGLVAAHAKGQLRFVGTSAHLADPAEFTALRRALYDQSWVVYAKRPFGGPEQVIRYLGRYTHRVAISNSRLVSVDDDAVVFRTHGDATCTLHPTEFLRRFLLHVLPKGFRKIRHAGLMAPSNIPTRFVAAKRILVGMRANRTQGAAHQPPPTPRAPPDRQCPTCQVGILYRRDLPPARAPPGAP